MWEQQTLEPATLDQTTMPQTTEIGDEAPRWCSAADEGRLAAEETILLVEDEGFVREVTGEVLRAAGYRVLAAANAAEAGRMYAERRGKVDLLLTDVVLPGETGRALASRLRREDPRLKVLVVTGYAEQMAGREALPEELLAKPFSTAVLLGRVREVLKGGRLLTEKENGFRRVCGSA
jgi:CheY-like chemotaxis protein